MKYKSTSHFSIFLLTLCLFRFAFAAEPKTNNYPLIFIPGLFGFGEHENPQINKYINYWGDIPDALRLQGYKVFVAKVSSVQTSKERAAQVILYLLALSENNGHNSFHLIGHSQGGLDAVLATRFLSFCPDLGLKIASITTVGSPHRGSKVADAICDLMEQSPLCSRLIGEIGNQIGSIIDTFNGVKGERDFKSAIASLKSGPQKSCEYKEIKIPCYSWGSKVPKSVAPWDIFALTHLFTSHVFKGEPNDGLVSVGSMRFGCFLQLIQGQTHMEQSGFKPSWQTNASRTKATELFLLHAQRLTRKKVICTSQSELETKETSFGIFLEPEIIVGLGSSLVKTCSYLWAQSCPQNVYKILCTFLRGGLAFYFSDCSARVLLMDKIPTNSRKTCAKLFN